MRIAILAFALAAASLSAQTGMADLRAAIVNTALGLKGVPYVYGAESPPDAVDCSGFVQYVYKKAAGLEIPRNSRQQWEAGYPITMSEDQARGCRRVRHERERSQPLGPLHRRWFHDSGRLGGPRDRGHRFLHER